MLQLMGHQETWCPYLASLHTTLAVRDYIGAGPDPAKEDKGEDWPLFQHLPVTFCHRYRQGDLVDFKVWNIYKSCFMINSWKKTSSGHWSAG